MNNTDQQTVEIDVILLLKKLWSRKFLILFFASLFTAVSLLVNIFLIDPEYTSTTSIYVVNQRMNAEGGLTTQELQAGTYLVRDYKEIIASKDVLTTVAQQDDVTVSASELSKSLSVSIPTDTRIIYISVKNEDPEVAANLANSVRQVASEKIKQVTNVDEVNVIEEAEVASRPSSPRIRRNAILGGLVGGFVAVIGIMLKEILDDRVKRPEDVEEILGVTLLGYVPKTSQLK